jgi:hypothetical protein
MPHLTKADKEAKISQTEATRQKEVALARLRQIEVEQLEGSVVDVELMERAWSTAIKTITGSLLALPDRRAPEIAALTDPRQVRDMLLGDIKQILSDLPAQIHETVKAAVAA